MNQKAPPAGPAPLPFPPGARPVETPAQRYQKLGTTCLWLGLLELGYCLLRLASQLLSGAMMQAERSLFPSTPHGPSASGVLDAGQAFTRQVAPWEAARTIPFLLATCLLLRIAQRLRRGTPARSSWRASGRSPPSV